MSNNCSAKTWSDIGLYAIARHHFAMRNFHRCGESSRHFQTLRRNTLQSGRCPWPGSGTDRVQLLPEFWAGGGHSGHAPFRVMSELFECKSRGGARGVTKAELSGTLIQRTTSEAPQRRYVLLPHAEKVKVAHPLMLRAIAAAKRKNDQIDARKIADCLRCSGCVANTSTDQSG